jgi:hypothetical protein
MMNKSGVPESELVHIYGGTSSSLTAGRIAYTFDLKVA